MRSIKGVSLQDVPQPARYKQGYLPKPTVQLTAPASANEGAATGKTGGNYKQGLIPDKQVQPGENKVESK